MASRADFVKPIAPAVTQAVAVGRTDPGGTNGVPAGAGGMPTVGLGGTPAGPGAGGGNRNRPVTPRPITNPGGGGGAPVPGGGGGPRGGR